MDPAGFIAPMLATTAEQPFDSPDWWYEVKWDGYRVLIHHHDRLNVYSRHGHDLLTRYPDLRHLEDVIPRHTILDGELVAWVDGHPSFSALQQRLAVPLMVMAFDCLYSRKQWHLHEPFVQRRAELEELLPSATQNVVVPNGVQGTGQSLLQAVREQHLEGVIAKRMDSRYVPGQRVKFWQKFLVTYHEWFDAIAVTPLKSGGWQWWIAEQQTRVPIARLPAPAPWSRKATIKTSGQVFTEPIRVEVDYRSRTERGMLRHAKIRQWREP